VDLGRCTPDGGNHQFKRHWSPLETPLRWQYWLAPGQIRQTLKREDARYQWPIRLWKRLPLSLANRLGPRLVRALP
jgi:serine/alanine adding enzyme